MDDSLPEIDRIEARTWIYPTNYEVREYQRAIAERALYDNTLVSLPTGMGKTLIAAVVMNAYYRWFPQGKVVFLGPTKPLVTQQMEAVQKSVAFRMSDIAHMDGSVDAVKRASLWRDRRIFFCTPQCFGNDIKSGGCNARKIVCVVFDEVCDFLSFYRLDVCTLAIILSLTLI